MHKYFLSLFALILISTSSNGDNMRGEKDPLEITYIKNRKAKADLNYQKQLRKSNSWQNFIKTHNGWSVNFNEATQMPHRAYGKPIQVNGDNPVSAAMNFIEAYLGEWNLPLQDLKFQSQNNSGKYYNVFYTQSYKGLDVINSKVFVKLTKDFRVNTWGTDVFKIDMSTIPILDVNSAIVKAKIGIIHPITDVTTPILKILPVPSGRNFVSHLVYEFAVSTMSEESIPARYYTLIDANTGIILYRHNQVTFFQPLNSEVNVVANIFELNPYVPSVIRPLRNLKVISGGTTQFTDSLGNVSLIGTNPLNTTFSLDGKWSKTLTDQSTTPPSKIISLEVGSDTLSFDSITTIRHTSGYYHVNIVHDFMKSFLPTFTGLDFALRTRIDIVNGQSCNAFYSPGNGDISFLATGGGCNCLSQVADVVYHEYGHAINSRFYQANGASFQNGAMGEGYGDIWGISITKIPIIGQGVSTSDPNSNFRRYDLNKKVYPQDLTGEVHDDGEIIAGAWYDLSLNLNSWQLMTELFTKTYYDLITGPNGDEGQVYTDILLAALTEDDDDADLSNGTPNDNAIIDAFALHGIYLINDANFEHEPVLSTTSSSATPITVSLSNSLPWLTPSLKLNYRIGNSGVYTTLPMLLVSGNEYSATIPQQSAGTIISYYVQYLDVTSTPLTTEPVLADSSVANIPYYILVDCKRDKIEDFDVNQSPGWETGISGDNATRGQWIIAPPLVSIKNGDTCQVGFQFTPGGTKCAVTGNAVSPSSPNYSADVNGGKTTLQSPPFDISGTVEPIISYWRWFTNNQGSAPQSEDFWQTFISGDGINFVPVENIAIPDHSWRRFAFKVSDYIPSASTITLRFVAEDSNIASVVEVALDDIEIYSKDLSSGISSINQTFNFSLYPNPVANTLTVDLNLLKSDKVSLDIVNNLGQTVLSSQLELSAGKTIKDLDIQKLSNGVYFLIVKSESNKIEKMFSVLK